MVVWCFFTSKDLFFFTGIAVATSDQIVLLSKDAKTARPLVEKFDSMRALTFDNQDQELIANDVRGDNETIFRIGVEEHSSKNSILHDLPDSIQVTYLQNSYTNCEKNF